MNTHLKGLMITTLGVLFVVPDALFVRLIVAEPMVVAFWRGLTSGLIILVGLMIWQGPGVFAQVLRSGWRGLLYMVLIGFTSPGFVLAVTNTSVANVVFIFASMPIFSAIFARVFLGEPISRRVVLTMGVVVIGLAIIAYGSHENALAHWSGDLFALMVCIAYAGALTVVRSLRDISMVPAIPIGYLGAALVILPFVAPFGAMAVQCTSTPGRFSAFIRSRNSCRAATLEMLSCFTPTSRRSSRVSPRGNSSRKITRSLKPGRRAKADALGELFQRLAHLFLVHHLLRAQTVAHHHPVDGFQPGLRAQLPRAPDHFGIDRGAEDLFAIGIDMGQQVEIDETVVERRDQRVGEAMGHLAQPGVRAGAVDQDEIAAVLQRGDGGGQLAVIDILALLQRGGIDLGQVMEAGAGRSSPVFSR
jgi:drug/metabolite transporter (DMT)-like permease